MEKERFLQWYFSHYTLKASDGRIFTPAEYIAMLDEGSKEFTVKSYAGHPAPWFEHQFNGFTVRGELKENTL